jgi:hypothetical protein
MKVSIGPYKDEGERKEEVHIHDYDTWSMDHTLGLIALPMLKQLKETKHGAPYVDLEDVPPQLHPKKSHEADSTDETHFQRWDYVMDEMVFAFESQNNDWEDQFHHTSEASEEDDAGFEFVGIGSAQLLLFPDENGDTEEYAFYEMKRTNPDRTDWEAYKAYAERVANGFRLFGKYYQSLWD